MVAVDTSSQNSPISTTNLADNLASDDASIDGADLRASNVRVGRCYDVTPYDEATHPLLDPQFVLGLSALYGCSAGTNGALDILDLGCGTGRLLEQFGGSGGKLVGTDISRRSCDLAQKRCAEFGARARIVHADILDLDPATLGRFDLVYNIGVIYTSQPPVQSKIIELIAACLKPGGVAVVSYYAGRLPSSLDFLRQTLSSIADRAEPFDAQIQRTKEQMRQIAQGDDPRRGQMIEALEAMSGREESTVFHEILAPYLTALKTSVIDAKLGARGVHFLNYLPPLECGKNALGGRAFQADQHDLATGGAYRFAIFGKLCGTPSLSAASRAVRWQTLFVRANPEIAYDVEAAFNNIAGGAGALVSSAAAQALLDELAAHPGVWDQVRVGALRRLEEHDIRLTADQLSQLEDELLDLWFEKLVVPLWRGADA